MMTVGAIKFLEGYQVMVTVGSMALGIFGIQEGSYVTLAATL